MKTHTRENIVLCNDIIIIKAKNAIIDMAYINTILGPRGDCENIEINKKLLSIIDNAEEIKELLLKALDEEMFEEGKNHE